MSWLLTWVFGDLIFIYVCVVIGKKEGCILINITNGKDTKNISRYVN